MSALTVLFLTLPLLTSAALALLVCALLVWAASNAVAGASLLLATVVIEATSLTPLALKLGLWIYLPDLVGMVLLCALAYRCALLGKVACIPWAWWLLGALQGALFLWGFAEHGTSAGVDYRQHFYVWVGVSYFATFAGDEYLSERLMWLLIPFAVLLCIVAVYRWGMSALDWRFQQELDQFVTTGIPFRVIWSHPTFVVALAMLMCMHFAMRGRAPLYGLLSAGLALIVVILQHRSVWVAGMAGVFTLVLVANRHDKAAPLRLTAVVVFAAVVTVSVLLGARGASESVQAQAARAISSGGTFAGDRVSGWKALVKDWANSKSLVTYLAGKPFGSGYTRYSPKGVQIEYQPHNYYVHLLHRGGIVGLGCFLWISAVGLMSTWREVRRGSGAAAVLLSMLVALLLYYVPYAISYEHAIILGLVVVSSIHVRLKQGISNLPTTTPPHSRPASA